MLLSRFCLVMACGLLLIPAAAWSREPLRLQTDRAELVISPEGGTITGFRLKGKPVNPLNWEVPDNFEAQAETKPARNLFAFSILYLFALFAALLVEHGLKGPA